MKKDTCNVYIISIHVGGTVASACIRTYINIYRVKKQNTAKKQRNTQ